MFRLALRQTEGLIGSILHLVGLDLAVPDHSTLSRRAATLKVPRPQSCTGPVHLLVDSTGLRLCGPGEWLIEKHGTRKRRSWRTLHIGVDAETGQILASELTTSDVDDGSQVEPLLDQITDPLASLTGDGTVNLSKLEQFECITLASKPLKVRNPRRPETVTKFAKSVKLTMPSRQRHKPPHASSCSSL